MGGATPRGRSVAAVRRRTARRRPARRRPGSAAVSFGRMSYRRWIAVLSLASGMVALYLALWKAGYMGQLVCGIETNGCEYVQGSRYGWFLERDVAQWGTALYVLIVATAVAGTSPRHEDARWPTLVLMVLVYWGFAFTAYLKYAEFVILHGFCSWCAVNAVVMTLNTILVTLDWRRVRRLAASPAVA